MNDKLIKAKEKHDKKHPIKSWWRKNGYKIMRVILFPIWISYEIKTRLKDKWYKELEFSPEVCKAYLDKVLPGMVAHYCEDAKCFLISNTDDMGDIQFCYFWQSSQINKKYESFFLKFTRLCEEYILNNYQIDGYQKMVLLNYSDWKQAAKKFDWNGTPYRSDYVKGVIFYTNKLTCRTN